VYYWHLLLSRRETGLEIVYVSELRDLVRSFVGYCPVNTIKKETETVLEILITDSSILCK
jgi:hypothetical protein